jgi:L-alanine-DL-glutamate epimerase-like enolase superfamily enzyme
MRIADVRARLLSCESSQPIKFAHMEIPSRSMILVEVTTDSGIIGFGEVDAWPTGDQAAISMINGKFRNLLLGEETLDIQRLWQEMYSLFISPMGRTRGLEIYAVAAIDMALWDILGKHLGQPVYRLLGAARNRVPAYASLGYVPLEQIETTVAGVLERGFRAFKVRIGVDPGLDEAIVRLARQVAGPDVAIMVDVNSGWNARESWRRAEKLEKYDIAWIEEPLPSHDISGTAELAARTNTPIALGEHQVFNRYDARDILLCGAASVIQPDMRAGGISECRRIADVAAAWDVPCVPHFFGNCIRLAAMAHLLGSIANAWVMEYDVSVNPLRTQLPIHPIEVVNGYVVMPDRPGLGVDLDEALVERWTVCD